MRLTRNFSLEQLIFSETALRVGIDNAPAPDIVKNLRLLAKGLEKVQALTGFPLAISSGYRCPELNRRVGGAKTSQHTLGLAADFTCAEFGSPVDIIKAIREAGIKFDQCILEYGRWVHLSFSKEPRGKLLTIYDPKAGYLDGLRDKGGKEIA
ncbi:MAG: peptidase M15 [Burkholderiales bacterium]|nr:peptidase M15 [Burkholderiales bacterium]